ncbi:MAG: methionyl-tRNA formyltransferase [Actinomycetota bacterium]|nr:methionyl-tRNA formyltransferase [Actinomycetota bacterium]
MRVAFLGNDAWSISPLRALATAPDIDVELVLTNPPRPAGRGSQLRPTVVAEAAGAMDLPLLETERVAGGEGFDALDSLDPDAIVVVAYGEILTPDVLDIPRLGAVNVHFSLLPRWRGAVPVQRAILEGDEATGVTVMLMDEGLDTGPILATAETSIEPEEDAGSLGARLSELGAPLLVETLEGLDEGTVEPRSQDHTAATYASKLLPDERTIDWGQPIEAIDRRVRAFAPEPGAVATFRGGRLKVLRVSALPLGDTLDASPRIGEIGVLEDDTPIVAARGGGIELLEVAPAGRRRMSGGEWARGARIQPGDQLT